MFPAPAHATGQPPRRRPGPKIQPFKRRADVAPDFAVDSCLALSSAFRDCYAGNARDLDFETLYRCAYDMVLFGHGEALYTQVATTMASEAEKLAASLLADHAAQTDGAFLRGLLGRWKTHSAAVAMINDVVRYMDAVFVPKRGKAPVRELGHREWLDGVVRSGKSPVRARLRDALLEMSRQERAGVAVDAELCGLMAGAARMLVELGPGAYEETLEAPFLDEEAQFYAVESVRLRLRLELGSSSSCGEYLGEVESMADAERARASRCGLDASQTGEKAAAVVLREMVEKDGVAMARLVAGLAAMLAEGKGSDLARMHRLLARVPGGLAAMRSAMEAHFREVWERAGGDEAVLSGEKDRYREMIDGVFHGEVSFHAALDSCFG